MGWKPHRPSLRVFAARQKPTRRRQGRRYWLPSKRQLIAGQWLGGRLGLVLVLVVGGYAVLAGGVDRAVLPMMDRVDQPSSVSGWAYVRDGDTIEVGGVAVRLQGLHCPEAG